MKRMIDPLEHATEILQGVQKGVLLTTKHGDRVNSMTMCRNKIYARSIQVILNAGTQPTKLVSAISIPYSVAKSLRHT